jgi:dihydrofolate synthase/folylpolyglutamate synthase
VVLTPIDRDHEKQLGREYAGIAREKAAIIKSGAIVFSARQRPETGVVFEPHRGRPEGYVSVPEQVRLADIRADGTGMRFSLTDTGRREEFSGLRLTLDGAHQADNAALAYLCARWYLESAGRPFSEAHLRRALASVRWPGRLQKVAENPDIIFDVSHNEAGIEATIQYAAARYPDQDRHLLLGLLADKDISRIVPMVGRFFSRVVVTEPVSPRKMAAADLQAVFRSQGIAVEAVPEIDAAYARAAKELTGNDVLFVMGSHFLIGELLKTIGKRT